MHNSDWSSLTEALLLHDCRLPRHCSKGTRGLTERSFVHNMALDGIVWRQFTASACIQLGHRTSLKTHVNCGVHGDLCATMRTVSQPSGSCLTLRGCLNPGGHLVHSTKLYTLLKYQRGCVPSAKAEINLTMTLSMQQDALPKSFNSVLTAQTKLVCDKLIVAAALCHSHHHV